MGPHQVYLHFAQLDKFLYLFVYPITLELTKYTKHNVKYNAEDKNLRLEVLLLWRPRLGHVLDGEVLHALLEGALRKRVLEPLDVEELRPLVRLHH